MELTRFYKHVKERLEILPGMSFPTNVKTWIIVNNRVSLSALFTLQVNIQVF